MGKRQSFGSARHYLDGHTLTRGRYLDKFYPIYDWHIIKHFFKENPIQAKVILRDFELSNEKKFGEVVKLFILGKSKIVYIVGARGSGKTATAFMLVEEVNREIQRPIYYIAPDVKERALPHWCKVVKDIQNAPQGCIGIVDEASLQYHAREFMKGENINMSKLLAIARHRDIFLIFITQDTALADTNIRRLRDIILWKKSNDYSLSEKGSRNTKEHQFWQKVRNMMAPRSEDECLFEFPAQKRFIHFKHELPECWTDNLSKMWKDTNFSNEKKEGGKGENTKPVKILKL